MRKHWYVMFYQEQGIGRKQSPTFDTRREAQHYAKHHCPRGYSARVQSDEDDEKWLAEAERNAPR